MRKTKTKAGSIKFEIEGSGDFAPTRLPAMVQRALAALKELPDGKLLKLSSLAARIDVIQSSLQQHSANPGFGEFRFKHKGRIYYGNQRTIAAARKEFSL